MHKNLEHIGKNQSKPLIGVDYVAQVFEVGSKEPTYLCLLCNKSCDPRNIVSQMVSHRHRLSFLVIM
jgi:hypothetical protein